MSYVYAGYGVAFGGLALYAIRVIARGRALRVILPPATPAVPPEGETEGEAG